MNPILGPLIVFVVVVLGSFVLTYFGGLKGGLLAGSISSAVLVGLLNAVRGIGSPGYGPPSASWVELLKGFGLLLIPFLSVYVSFHYAVRYSNKIDRLWPLAAFFGVIALGVAVAWNWSKITKFAAVNLPSPSTRNNFDWLATDSAPKNYPMKIIDGTFFYHGQERGLYIPSGGVLFSGWGQMVSSHVVGEDLKPLPDRLEVTFFSYTENAFYHGEFDLPYDVILRLFREGYISPGENGRTTYDRIMCGVAPGGTVAVWLLGTDKITEVFSGQAKRVDVDWQEVMGISPDEREQVVNKKIEAFVEPSVRESIRKNGIPFGNWSTTFRKRYRWTPSFTVENPPAIISNILLVNGERESLSYPLAQPVASQARAVPCQLIFSYESPKGWNYPFIIHFDETEVVEGFARLGGHNELLQLELEPHYPPDKTQIRLRNDGEVITLKNFTVEKIEKEGEPIRLEADYTLDKLLKEENWQEVIDVASKGIQESPEHINFYLSKAMAQGKLNNLEGSYATARQGLSFVKEMDPDGLVHLNWFIYICALTSRDSEAVGAWRKFRDQIVKPDGTATALLNTKEGKLNWEYIIMNAIQSFSHLKKYKEGVTETEGYLATVDGSLSKGGVFYNAACLTSLSGDTEKALLYMKKAILAGKEKEAFKKDSDFDSIRDLAEFKRLVEE